MCKNASNNILYIAIDDRLSVLAKLNIADMEIKYNTMGSYFAQGYFFDLQWSCISPMKPKAGAPVASASTNCARCSTVKPGANPGAVRRRRAAPPPAVPRFTQWLTAPWVTSSAAAMAVCFQP